MLVRFSVSEDSGLEIYAYEAKNSKQAMIEPQLLAGLMTAIQMYAETVGQTIQHIQFSNLILYLQCYGNFTIRLLVSEMIDKEEIKHFFDRLAKEIVLVLPNLSEDYNKNEITFNERLLPILKPLIQDPLPEIDDQTLDLLTQDTFSRIALVGLANAGKTSIINLFFENWSQDRAKDTKPTIGLSISQKFLDFVKHRFAIMDFGGQDQFRQRYLTQTETWEDISALIFVIDIQDKESFEPAREYLSKIWELVTKVNERKPKLTIFMHKYDPDKRKQLHDNLKQCLHYFKDSIESSVFHLTTVEDSSTRIALIKTLYFSLPNVMLSRLLEEEFIDYFEENIWPRFSKLVNDTSFQDEKLKAEIRQSAVILGMNHGLSLQESWLEYLTDEWTPKPRLLQAKSLAIRQEGQILYVTITDFNEGQAKNLSTLLLDGMLEGILKTFQLRAPEIIEEQGIFTTWKITF
ncbi:MAG: ADP-ribosylation factor-like protein [Candidatus Hodarchaeota archaeon]